MMKFCDLDAQSAIAVAKRARPAINPIGSFPVLLGKLERALLEEKVAQMNP